MNAKITQTNRDGFSITYRTGVFDAFHKAGKDEMCGALMGGVQYIGENITNISLSDIVLVPNGAENPVDHFVIKGNDLKNAVLGEYGVVGDALPFPVIGFLHTHMQGGPDPSFDDVLKAQQDRLNVVYHPSTRTVTLYTREGYLTKFVLKGNNK